MAKSTSSIKLERNLASSLPYPDTHKTSSPSLSSTFRFKCIRGMRCFDCHNSMEDADDSGAEDNKKRVVIIGGGISGSIVAHSLQFSADVILVDQKEYFEIPWGSIRALVEPLFAERTVINHSDYLTNARIIVSTATDIREREIVTADGHSIAYDYLVIATGHMEFVPRSRAERVDQYQAECERIRSAASVLIVGGGPTGVELAAEIVYNFPEKKVILAHRGLRLLEFIGFKASQKALDWLTSKKVEVILDQSINLNTINDGYIQMSNGETIKADCYYVCMGKPMGSSWLHESILLSSLDLRGRLMVDENLRVRGHKNVFGIGDITDIKEIKQGYLAQRHAQVVVRNLKLLLAGADESKMATYRTCCEMAIVSLGRKEAVAQLPLLTISGCIPGMVKSGDLFVGRTRRQLGLTS